MVVVVGDGMVLFSDGACMVLCYYVGCRLACWLLFDEFVVGV